MAGTKVEVICNGCGKSFLKHRCYLKRGHKHHFCSKQCEGEFRSLHNTTQSYQGGTILRNGYRYIRLNGVQKEEHRIVMEQIIGRPLHGNEIVHHINGNKLDNRPENLVIMTRSEHMKLHAKPLKKRACKRCGKVMLIHGRGLCGTCYSWVREHDGLADYPIERRKADE